MIECQSREKGHPALPMRLPQPISLHVLFSNTVIFCVTECAGGLPQKSDIYKREVEYTVRISDK